MVMIMESHPDLFSPITEVCFASHVVHCRVTLKRAFKHPSEKIAAHLAAASHGKTYSPSQPEIPRVQFGASTSPGQHLAAETLRSLVRIQSRSDPRVRG
jgi:hypothetical protein